MKTNRFGLKRVIPSPIKRQIRKRCGFGCIICGCALIEYEHFSPEFKDAREHNPNGITLLCPSCHEKKTRGFISPETISAYNANPYCKREGISSLQLHIGTRPMTVTILDWEITDTSIIIKSLGTDLLKIEPPEAESRIPQISAVFYNSTGDRVASIYKNKWIATSNSYDIETIGSRIIIRENHREICLELEIEPPSKIYVKRLKMNHKNTRYELNEHIFRITRPEGNYLELQAGVKNQIVSQPYAFIVRNNGFDFSSGSKYAIKAWGNINIGGQELRSDKISCILRMPRESEEFPQDQPVTEIKIPKPTGEFNTLIYSPPVIDIYPPTKEK